MKIRNRAIILCGVPTSGKSSWVAKNGDGYMVVSSDNIIENYAKHNHNEDRTKTVPDSVLESMHSSYVRPTVDEGFLSVYSGEEFSLVPVNNLAQQQAISF